MFIKKVFDFFFAKLPLEHILDGKLFGLFNEGKDFIEFCWFEDGVGFDDGDCIGEVLLFGVEQ